MGVIVLFTFLIVFAFWWDCMFSYVTSLHLKHKIPVLSRLITYLAKTKTGTKKKIFAEE